MSNKPSAGRTSSTPTPAEAITEVFWQLRTRLPRKWEAELHVELLAVDRGIDALYVIRSPGGESVALPVTGKQRLEPRDVDQFLAITDTRPPNGGLFVVAPYLSPRTRARLRRAGVAGYGDATGNLFLHVDAPAVFIDAVGASTDPQPAHRALRSLRGPAAARVVRALCDFFPPFNISELAARADTSIPSTSRAVGLIEREALIEVERGHQARVIDVKWRQLIHRWSEDYSFFDAHRTAQFLAPRGFEPVVARLETEDWRFAVTGSLAAVDLAPIAPPRLAMIYVDPPRDARGGLDQVGEELGLQRTERGGNVVLAEPFDRVVFDRIRDARGGPYVAPSQAAADLLTGPGRSPQEAERLFDWMEQDEYAWRT